MKQPPRSATWGVLTFYLAIIISGGTVRADLWTDGGFEGNLGWTGTDSFMGESATIGAAANQATFYSLVHGDLITESGVWVDDPTRAFAGDRMFWLRNYDDPDTICVGHRLNNVLVAGESYKLTFSFAAFNPDFSAGSNTEFTKPAIEVMAYDDTATAFVAKEQKITFSNGSVRNPATNSYSSFALSDWNNLQWHEATATFDAPESNGRPVYVWASMTNDSAGMLLDNVVLQAVPEPTSVGVGALLVVGLTFRRRRTG